MVNTPNKNLVKVTIIIIEEWINSNNEIIIWILITIIITTIIIQIIKTINFKEMVVKVIFLIIIKCKDKIVIVVEVIMIVCMIKITIITVLVNKIKWEVKII